MYLGGFPANIWGGPSPPVDVALGGQLGLVVAVAAILAHQFVGVGAVGGLLRHQRHPHPPGTPVVVHLEKEKAYWFILVYTGRVRQRAEGVLVRWVLRSSEVGGPWRS